VNQNGPNLYWVDNTANTVDQASKLGGNITVLASGRVKPQAIAVDPSDDFVYWVDFGDMTGVGANGTVNSTAVGGGGAVKTLVTGEDQPEGIAVDGTNVYWTSGANPGTVKMLAINAPAGTAPTIVASNLGSPHGIGIDSEYIYWTNYDDNSVMKAPIAGGASPYSIAKGTECDNPDALFVDMKNVYWANKGNGQIVKLAK
jgi:serine/threonine-protein kinase